MRAHGVHRVGRVYIGDGFRIDGDVRHLTHAREQRGECVDRVDGGVARIGKYGHSAVAEGDRRCRRPTR